MSLRLEMLQVARLAPKLLGDSTELVEKFFRSQQNDDGGFKDRAGRSDLYYTVFGMEGLRALQAELPLAKTENFLRSFGTGENLDFVHLCCLARGAAGMENFGRENFFSQDSRQKISGRIEAHRTKDGGYNQVAGSDFASVYGCFLALGAYQDLKLEMPEPLCLVQSLKFLETDDGAWANDRNLKIGSTNATAAAVAALRNLNMPIHQNVGAWLLARCHSEGGFLAMPNAPIPDLLSTATALHALAGMQIPFESVKEKCLDFIDTLWMNEGGFHGYWSDAQLDCEYTYYALLALGHLSF